MSGLHDLSAKSFWETSTASALYVVAMLWLGTFHIVPALRGEWTMAHHGFWGMFVLGIGSGVCSALTFKAYSQCASGDGRVDATARKLMRCGVFLAVVAFILIAIPAFVIKIG